MDANKPDDFYHFLTPEELQQYAQLGGLNEQQGDLDTQLQQADALRKPAPERQHYGLWGGMLSGIANGLNAHTGIQQEKTLQAQKADNRAKQAELRGGLFGKYGAYEAQLAKAAELRRQQSAAPGPYSSAPQPVEGQQDYSQAGAYPFLFGGQ